MTSQSCSEAAVPNLAEPLEIKNIFSGNLYKLSPVSHEFLQLRDSCYINMKHTLFRYSAAQQHQAGVWCRCAGNLSDPVLPGKTGIGKFCLTGMSCIPP